MLEFLKNIFNKSDDESLLSDTENSNIQFVLKINNDSIGTLEYNEDIWLFEYSDDFRNQTKYNRIIGFSDLNKTYKNEILWPFFKIRIPGLKQPLVQEILQEENINKNDEASLLKRFGRINISNPYILEIA